MEARLRLKTVATHLLLGGAVAFAALPLLWAVKSSFMPTGQIINTGILEAPDQWTTRNFLDGLSRAPWRRYFLNSTVIATAVTLLTLVTSATAGYGFAKFQFRGRRALFGLVLVALMMPFQAVMIPLFVQVRALGWLDSYQGLIVPGAVSAFGIFMMRQFMTAVPDELLEAARLDGCSEWQVFNKIVLPLARGPLAALAALTFLASWNNFLYPLLVVQSQALTTVPLGLVQFRGPYGTDYGEILAVSTLSALPAIVIFVLMRRHIVASFATSGLK